MAPDRPAEWFDDDRFWHELYPFVFSESRFAAAYEEVERMLALTKPAGRNVLDLCCGPGRCAIPLATQGYCVTGVDRTGFLLEQAVDRCRRMGVSIEFVQQDMRDFVRPDSYDLVINYFTSFGYFDNQREDVEVLRNICRSLRPGGTCLIELVGKEYLARVFQPTTSHVLDDGSLLVERHEIIDDWTRIRNEWILIRDTGVYRARFHHTVYSGLELKDRMIEAGLHEIKLYGSLQGAEYGVAAERLIAVGRKPGNQKALHEPPQAQVPGHPNGNTGT